MHSVGMIHLYSISRQSILIIFFSVLLSIAVPLGVYAEAGNDLIRASFNGDLNAVNGLLAQGTNVNEQNNEGITPLFMAAYKGHLDVVRMLLSHGADVNAVTVRGHDTALIVASQNGYAEVVKELLKKKPDINARNSQGATSLILASAKGYTAIVKVLLVSGADVGIKTYNSKMTALDAAKQGSHDEIIRLLGKSAKGSD